MDFLQQNFHFVALRLNNLFPSKKSPEMIIAGKKPDLGKIGISHDGGSSPKGHESRVEIARSNVKTLQFFSYFLTFLFNTLAQNFTTFHRPTKLETMEMKFCFKYISVIFANNTIFSLFGWKLRGKKRFDKNF